MIKEIQELNFPKYATLSQATVSLQDMAESTISTQVKIAGDITPDFTYDWEIKFRGHKYIMPLRTPQGSKENTSLHSVVDLTFQHWAEYQLKRWYFFSIVNLEAGTVLPDQYECPISLNLKDFCTLFGKVLNYYYGDQITIDFNDPETNKNGWIYDSAPATIEISHSYIWDVLIQFYELYKVRWNIEPYVFSPNLMTDADEELHDSWVPNYYSVVRNFSIAELGLKAGEQITYSLDLRSDSGRRLRARIEYYNSDGDRVSDISTIDVNSSGRSWITSFVRSGYSNIRLLIDGALDKNEPAAHEKYTKVKLCRGTDYRWDNGKDNYVIKVGYPTAEIGHIFKYGFEGGLLKVERQVQDDNIRNILIGRGGEKNLPYRYYKDIDKENDSFPADPDWVPELADMYFSELRSATFRSYVQGWNHAHYKRTAITSADQAYEPWAWMRGYSDTKFNPIEYVADEFTTTSNGYYVKRHSSIDKYGELMGSVENNEEIYPTIQGVNIKDDNPDIGYVDEIVDIEQIVSDDVEEAVDNYAKATDIDGGRITTTEQFVRGSNNNFETTITCGKFTVGEGLFGTIDSGDVSFSAYLINDVPIASQSTRRRIDPSTIVLVEVTPYAVNSEGKLLVATGLSSGTYTLQIKVKAQYTGDQYSRPGISHFDVTSAISRISLMEGDSADEEWKGTFDIWIKNIWQSERQTNESDENYTDRIWGPILGDRAGNEAKIVFSSGWLSTSEDYEFTIIKNGVHFDDSKSLNGVPSHWRLTLAKSDAELESSGLYIPSTRLNGNPGDRFFFIGIDMPYQYVIWAEQRLSQYLSEELNKIAAIQPTWVVSTDRVRLNGCGDPNALIHQIKPGCRARLADDRFGVSDDGITYPYTNLYVQSLQYTYREATETDAALNPDLEIVLSDDVTLASSPVDTIQGSVDRLNSLYSSVAETLNSLRAFGDTRYLRKDGIPERSTSPTTFDSAVSSTGFRNGIVGGAGWGFFKDENGNWVLETDRINVREDLQVNNFTINQVLSRGGTIIESAAGIEVLRIIETPAYYRCYFDRKGGSVSNLFMSDDIGYCSRYDSASSDTIKYYRRRILRVGIDYIDLTKGYDATIAPDGENLDTGVEGNGVPEVGDVILQFGNYSDANRRFVKVLDVIGGGYERYLQGLDWVGAEGVEYYFAGRIEGQSPRLFIGSKNGGYLEFNNDRLDFKGVINAMSTIGDKNVARYISDMALTAGEGTRNLLLNSKGVFTYGVDEEPQADWDMWLWDTKSTVKLKKGETYTIRAYTDGVFRNSHADSFGDHDAVVLWLINEHNGNEYITPSDEKTNTSEGTSFVWPYEDAVVFLRINYYGANHVVSNVMLVAGNLITPQWAQAPEESDVDMSQYDYLVKALQDASKESTTINGGLIMTSLLRLGISSNSGAFQTWSGVSGLFDETQDNGGYAFWGGGDWSGERIPTFAIYHDGTGYAANKVVQFLSDSLKVGKSVVLDSRGLKLLDSEGNTKLMVVDEPIAQNLDVETNGFTFDSKEQTELVGVGVSANQAIFGFDAEYTIPNLIEVAAGEISIEFQFKISYPALPAGQTTLYTWYEVEILCDDISVGVGATKPFYFPIKNGSRDFQGSISINVPISKTGRYKVRISSDSKAGAGDNYLYWRVFGTVNYSYDNRTILGNDGLLAKWENASLIVTKNNISALVGNYGLRITDSGLYYKSASKKDWTSWNPAN